MKKFYNLGAWSAGNIAGHWKAFISRLTNDLKDLGKHSVSLPAKDCLETGKLSYFQVYKRRCRALESFCVLICHTAQH